MEPANLFHKLPKELNGLLLSGLKYIYVLKKDNIIFGAFHSLQDVLFASLENHKDNGVKQKNIYDEKTNTWTYACSAKIIYSYHIQEIEADKFIDMYEQINDGTKIIYVVVGRQLVKLTINNYSFFAYDMPGLRTLHRLIHDPKLAQQDMIKDGGIIIHNTFKFDYPPLKSFDLPEIVPKLVPEIRREITPESTVNNDYDWSEQSSGSGYDSASSGPDWEEGGSY